MTLFVNENSIVRKIWSKTDNLLFIFGGAAAEFALNKAVDWLYFTNKLPKDPIGRFFSTVAYSQKIIFAEEQNAKMILKSIRKIHQNVEQSRGEAIPDWAYRDVLYMLIHYSIVSFEVLERSLTLDEKREIFNVFKSVGEELGLIDLPNSFEEWQVSRIRHLENDLIQSVYSLDLFKRYKEELGSLRFKILVEVQKLLVPPKVYQLLELSSIKWCKPIVLMYKTVRNTAFTKALVIKLLPRSFEKQLKMLENVE